MTLLESFSMDRRGEQSSGQKGWFISRRCALILVISVLVILIGVGLAVHFLSPDRGDACSEAGTATDVDQHKGTKPSPKSRRNIRLPRDLVPVLYKIKLKPDFYGDDPDNYRFYGEVEIQMRCQKTTSSVVIHSADLVIDHNSVRFFESGSVDQKWSVKKFSADTELHMVTFNFSQNLISGNSYVLQMKFNGSLKDDMRGLYWGSYTEGNITKRLVTSQMEPTLARRVFPCFDEPDFKAKFQITLVRKANMTSLSNMDIIGTTKLSDGWFEDEFEQTPVLMSTYLLAFTVCSDFEYVQNNTKAGTRFRVYARREVIRTANYALNLGIKINEFFETYLNICYPLSKQDMLAVPDFGPGAMENWGLIIYRENALLYDPESSSLANKLRVATVVAHELAHQWFGNLVTLAWWDDIWLNEGFANYLEYHAMKHAETDWNIMEYFVIYELQSVLTVDSLSTTHPIFLDLESDDQTNSIFDSITYAKGASVIRMMEYVLGKETFQKGLTRYLLRHQYSNVNHTQLWKALTEQSDEDRAVTNLEGKMDPWITQPGYPLVIVNISRRSGQPTMTVSQKPFISDQSDSSNPENWYSDNIRWSIPFTYTTSIQPTWTNNQINWTETENVSFPVNISGGSWNSSSWIIGNIGQFGYYRVNYDDKNWENLVRQLTTDHTVIDVKNRAQIIDDAFQIGRAGVIDQTIALNLTEYLDRETNYMPWTSALSNLGHISTMLDRSPAYGQLEEYILKKLVPVYDHVGWDEKHNDTHDTRLLRSEIIQSTCFYGHRDCLSKAFTKYRDWMKSSIRIPGDLKQVVYCYGIREGGREEWDFAYASYESSANSDEKVRLLSALACTRTPWLLSRYLNYTWEKLRKQDAPNVFSYIARNPVGRYLAWNFFRSQWSIIQQRYAKGSTLLPRVIKAATSAFNTESELNQLTEFGKVSAEELGTGSSAYAQAVETIQLNMKWMTLNEAKISNWLQRRNRRQ